MSLSHFFEICSSRPPLKNIYPTRPKTGCDHAKQEKAMRALILVFVLVMGMVGAA